MDDAGIDVAVMSVSTPGVHTGDSAKAAALARRCNEFAADLVRTKPDRFASFACIPLPDVDASLKELSYASTSSGSMGWSPSSKNWNVLRTLRWAGKNNQTRL